MRGENCVTILKPFQAGWGHSVPASRGEPPGTLGQALRVCVFVGFWNGWDIETHDRVTEESWKFRDTQERQQVTPSVRLLCVPTRSRSWRPSLALLICQACLFTLCVCSRGEELPDVCRLPWLTPAGMRVVSPDLGARPRPPCVHVVSGTGDPRSQRSGWNPGCEQTVGRACLPPFPGGNAMVLGRWRPGPHRDGAGPSAWWWSALPAGAALSTFLLGLRGSGLSSTRPEV